MSIDDAKMLFGPIIAIGRDVTCQRYAWTEKWRPKQLSRAQRHGKHLSNTHRKKHKILGLRMIAKVMGGFIMSKLTEDGIARKVLPAVPVDNGV